VSDHSLISPRIYKSFARITWQFGYNLSIFKSTCNKKAGLFFLGVRAIYGLFCSLGELVFFLFADLLIKLGDDTNGLFQS
jgi:hypothetical protein